MSTEIIPAVPDESVINPEKFSEVPARAVYAEVSRTELPVIPEHWRRENIGATLRYHGRRHAHRTAYHGVRMPFHLGRFGFYAVRGAGRLTAALVRWCTWTDGALLESMAVAQGRLGHADAMKAHTEGKKTRAARTRVTLVFMVMVAVAVVVMVTAAPGWVDAVMAFTVVVTLIRAGKPHGRPLVQPAVIGGQMEKLTPDVIIRALGALGLAGINQVLREGKEIMFIAPGVHRDGPGWRVTLDLPYGVTVAEVMDRRDKLASGLRRPLGCVWPEESPDHAGRLVLYVCDEPLSKARQPAWPLAKAQSVSVFSDVPFGTDQRGKVVNILLMFGNLLIGSIPRQGKTVAVRNVLLAAALDPLTELRVFELKGTGDLDPLSRCCHAYGSGADDDTVEACLRSLQQVAEKELVKRAETIRSLPKDICPESKVTPELVKRKSLGLHPMVFAIDEAQEAFSHPQYGKAFDRYATQVIKRGPALGIMLVLATQRPDKDSIPTGVTSNVAIRFCLRVMDQVANDMVLGTSAYKSGIRATLMTPSDKGCGYLVGAEERPQVVKTFNIDGKKAEVIAARARMLREQAGTITGFAAGEENTAPARDVLADVLAVLGPDESGQHWQVIAQRLSDAFPDRWAGASQDEVSAQCRALGVPSSQVKAGGVNRQGCRRLELTKAQAAGV